MNDLGDEFVEELLKEIEGRIKKQYDIAFNQLKEKAEKYLSRFETRDNEKWELFQNGELSFQDYTRWRAGQFLVGERWDKMRDLMALDLVRTRELCAGIINSEMFNVFATNYNFQTYLVERELRTSISFTLFNRQSVANLIENQPNLLPLMEVDGNRVYRWSVQHIQSSITQSVMQGESIPHIASRLRDVTEMDRRSSVRNARTALTSAQNAGRQQSFENARDHGVRMKKQWLATIDPRTRHSHVQLDGQVVGIDEDFEVVADGEVHKLKYPSDPNCDYPEEVYNCRCTMLSVIQGFENDVTQRAIDPELGNITYEEWKERYS